MLKTSPLKHKGDHAPYATEKEYHEAKGEEVTELNPPKVDTEVVVEENVAPSPEQTTVVDPEEKKFLEGSKVSDEFWAVGNTFAKGDNNYILKEDGWHIDTGNGEGWLLEDQDDFLENQLQDAQPSTEVSLNNDVNAAQTNLDEHINITEEELLKDSFFDDTEDAMVINLRENDYIKNNKIKVEGPDDDPELDARGGDDIVRLTHPWFPIKLEISKSNPKYVEKLNEWLLKVKQAESDAAKGELQNFNETGEKTDVTAITSEIAVKGVETETNSSEITDLKNIIKGGGPTQVVADATQKLEEKTGELRDKEFDQTWKSGNELVQKYNQELEEKQEQHANYLREQGIEENSVEWDSEMAKIKDQHDVGFGEGNITIVQDFENNKELYTTAITNLKKDIARGYGTGFVGEDSEVDFSEWLPEDEEWKLLDGLTQKDIQELAGGKFFSASEATKWSSERKQEHVRQLQKKIFGQENRDSIYEYNLIEEENKEIAEASNKLDLEKENLNKETTSFNTKMEPVLKQLTIIEKDKNKKEQELSSLYKGLESGFKYNDEIGGFKGRDKSSFSYQSDLAKYNTKFEEYNSFMESNKGIFAKYEELQKEGDILTKKSEAFNKKLESNNNRIERFKGSIATAGANRSSNLEKYSLTITDGVLKSTSSDYKNVALYEKWRKENKIEKGFFDKDTYGMLGSGLLNTGAKYATGTPLFIINGLDALTGDRISGGEERFSGLDALNSMYERYTNYDYFGTAKDEDYEGGELKGGWNKGARAIAQGLPFMLSIMASGGKDAFKAGTWTRLGSLAMGKKVLDLDFANGIRMAKTAFHITSMDNFIEGKQMGLSTGQAFAYGGTISTITGMVQMIMPDIKFTTGTGSFVSNIVKGQLVSSLKNFTTRKGMQYAVTNWGTNILKEFAEEGTEMVLGDIAKASFGLSHTQESTEVDNWFRMMHDTAWLSGGMGTVGATKDFNEVRTKVHTELKGDISGFMETVDNMEIELTKKLNAAKEIGNFEGIKAYEFELDNIVKTKEYVKNFKNAINVAPANVTDGQLTDLTEKMRLLELKKNQDPSFHADIDAKIEAVDKKIQDSVIEQNRIATNKKVFEQTVKSVKALAEQSGSQVQEFENETEVNKYLEDNNIKSKFDSGTYGAYIDVEVKDENGNGTGEFVKTLIINKDASQSGEGINVAAHEFLHQMLETTFAKKDADGNIIRDADGNIVIDKKAALGVGRSLAEWVSEVQGQDFADSELLKRLDSYGDQPTNVQSQEMLTLLSDAIVTGDMAFEETIFTKLGDVVRRGLQAAGMDIKFNTGKDVYNFIKDYNRSIAKGKGLSKAQQKVMTQGAVIGGDVAQNMQSEDVTELAKMDDIEERREVLAEKGIDPDSDEGKALLMSKPSNVASLLEKNDNNATSMINNTLSKTKDGRNVFELKDNDGNYVDNAMVLSEFGQEIAPIVETIAKRLFDPIPSNLRNDISRNQFMNELTVMAATFTDKEFKAEDLGAGQTIDDFISNRLNLRANKLASDLGIESTVEQGGLGAAVDLDQAAELEAEELGPITEKTPGMVLVKKIATSEQVGNIAKAIKSKIQYTPSGEFKINVGKDKKGNAKFKNISQLDYKTLPNLVQNQVADLFGVKAVENYTSSTKTLKNDDVIRARMFIGKNADAILAALPNGVTASGTATGVKQVVLKNFYTKSDKRVSFDKKEGGAGIFPQIKNKMSGAEFAAVFGVEKGKLMSVKGQNPATLISGLMDEVGKAITNQTVRQELDKMNTAQDKDVVTRINMLGDGKSDIMFSNAAIAKTGAERSVMFYDKMSNLKGNNLTIADGNITNALEVHFDKEIKNGTFNVVNKKGKVTQTTEQLIKKVAAQIQPIYDRMTSGRTIPSTQEFNGQLISDIVVEQFMSDELNDTKSYKSVAGKDIQSINNPEVGKSARKAMQKLATKFDKSFVEKYLVPSISHSGRYANGEYKFKPGTLEYEINKNFDGSRNRFGLAGGAADARALLGVSKSDIVKKERGGMKVKSHEPPKAGDGIPSQDNMTKIITEQKAANQAFRDVVAELKKLYNNGKGEISRNDVVAILQSMNANPRALTRMSAILDYIPSGKDAGYKGAFRLEHMTPALQINLSALNSILSSKGSQTDIDFKNDMDGYKVAYLPMKYDNLVNTLYKSTKPIYGLESIFRYYNPELPGFDLEMKQISTGNNINAGFVNDPNQQALFKKNNTKAVTSDKLYFSKASDLNAFNKANKLIKPKLNEFKTLGKAIVNSRTPSEAQGITVLDFDDTLATTKSLVKFTKPDGTTGTLNAEQYANTYEDLLDKGYTFDFSDFNKVVKGKLAPLFQKAIKLQNKFGPKNMFILTARPMAAQKAIFDFLKANGLNIPMENITGLGNSTSEAKALWIADKVGEGYNDFYFADDALQNVQAVKNMLDQFDVKSKVQQAKIKFSKGASTQFNDILENITGIESKKRFSAIKARKRGANKGRFRFFIPPSHEDFVGLLYNFMGKGKEGNAHRDFWEKSLIRPLNRAYRELNAAKQSIANDFKSLNKKFPDVKKKLTKKTPDGDFTYQDAVRVYLWNKHGHKIPGLSTTDQAKLTELVMSDSNLQAYAETINIISKQDTYINPTEGWEAGDIRTDLDDATGRVGRDQFFTEFNENSEIIFSEENLNKIEAAYGADVVSAIKDILYRTKTGRNRPSGQNKTTNAFMNYLNGSVAATMFFNIRSAVLQQMSMVNFINFGDNNILNAGKAFANQKQYWKDWAYIFNSDFMKQRRGGIKTDINGAELAASLRGAKNTPRALLAKLLEFGFLPTQIGDNVAIATGGATFLRNRINTYLKQGLTQKEAESKAFIDFQVLAEATQQSARPDMVSQQQASPLGKIILAFQNVTSQFNRLGKKAFLDIKNRRITPGNTTQLQSDASNASRIAYYFAIQNAIFYTLQTALFSALFDDDDEDERMIAKKERVINGSIDSVLRGSGVMGAVISTLKNMAIAYHKQREKDWNGDEASVLVEALNVSPPLGIKARKIVNAERTLNYNRSVIDEMSILDIDNPQWSANTSYVEALTNIPLNRLYNKTQNIRQSLDNQHAAYQRVLMFSGWSQWNIGLGDSEKIEAFKKTVKEKKKIESKIKSDLKKEQKQAEEQKKIDDQIKKEKQQEKEGKLPDPKCSNVNSKGKRCNISVAKAGDKCTIHESVPQNKTGKKTQCKKIKEGGKRCGMKTSNKSGLCYYHD